MQVPPSSEQCCRVFHRNIFDFMPPSPLATIMTRCVGDQARNRDRFHVRLEQHAPRKLGKRPFAGCLMRRFGQHRIAGLWISASVEHTFYLPCRVCLRELALTTRICPHRVHAPDSRLLGTIAERLCPLLSNLIKTLAIFMDIHTALLFFRSIVCSPPWRRLARFDDKILLRQQLWPWHNIDTHITMTPAPAIALSNINSFKSPRCPMRNTFPATTRDGSRLRP